MYSAKEFFVYEEKIKTISELRNLSLEDLI